MNFATVDRLLKEPDDFELCNGVAELIWEWTGNLFDVVSQLHPSTIVTLVWDSYGLIGNGGFQYLFEGNFSGDPGFRKTARAFREIGALQAAATFEDALALFPNCDLPDDIDQRLDIYQSYPESTREALDDRMLDADDEIEHALATFIRTRSEEFRRLLSPQRMFKQRGPAHMLQLKLTDS